MVATPLRAHRRYLFWSLLALAAVAAAVIVMLVSAPGHPVAVQSPPASSALASPSPAASAAVVAPVCPSMLDLAWWPQMQDMQASGQHPVAYTPIAGIACRYPGRATVNDGALASAVPLDGTQLTQLRTMLNQLREPGNVFACSVNPQWTDVLVLARPDGQPDPIYGQLDTISINLGGCDMTSSRVPGFWQWSTQLRRYLDGLFGGAGVA
jgi:hypothetical protein